MKLPRFITRWIAGRLDALASRRAPDFIIGGADDPYLLRWYLIPRNPVLNLYLHEFRRDDDDRALHDHPWQSASLTLSGAYTEHTIADGGIHQRATRRAGDLVFRGAQRAHRIELVTHASAVLTPDGLQVVPHALPCRTLFLTGPRIREWGFHCPERGWVHWRAFTNPNDTGTTGKGCDA